MATFIENASAILSQSQRTVEISSQNISNVATAGYKRHISFEKILTGYNQDHGVRAVVSSIRDYAAGRLIETGSPTDLAINGDGFLVVRSGSGVHYTRHGEFQRDAEGRLVTAEGFVLQANGGSDFALAAGEFEILEDGTVVQAGAPVAKLAIVDFGESRSALVGGEGGLFSAPEGLATPVERPSVRQGFVEASNVSTGDEMVAMMAAVRRAETGQRLVNVYDELMGRALTAFGQG